jgi:hypothetical protein
MRALWRIMLRVTLESKKESVEKRASCILIRFYEVNIIRVVSEEVVRHDISSLFAGSLGVVDGVWEVVVAT